MTFQDFLEKYNGKYLDFDGYYGGQCMDLMHQYCVEVLGIADGRVLAAPSARDVYANFATVKGHELFEQIGNTPTGVPQEGDIMFWGNAPYGHVAVFVSGDANRFKSFDQNSPVGSPCHIQDHTYANVVGWLRFKGSPQNQTIIEQLRAERDTNWNLYQGSQQKVIELEGVVEQKNKVVDALTRENLDLKDQVQKTTEEKNAALASLQSLKIETEKYKSLHEKAEIDLGICKAQRKDLAKYTSLELIKEVISRFHV